MGRRKLDDEHSLRLTLDLRVPLCVSVEPLLPYALSFNGGAEMEVNNPET
jgi:hypothetical protein